MSHGPMTPWARDDAVDRLQLADDRSGSPTPDVDEDPGAPRRCRAGRALEAPRRLDHQASLGLADQAIVRSPSDGERSRMAMNDSQAVGLERRR